MLQKTSTLRRTPIRRISARKRARLVSEHEAKRRIMARDGWRCRLCGGTDYIGVHHISPQGQHGSKTYDECWRNSNMITLCEPCHSEAHSPDGRARCRAAMEEVKHEQ